MLALRSPSSISPLLCLVFLLCLLYYPQLALAKCHPDDESGLLAFKTGITEDPSGMLQSWKPATDCCAWAGVSCEAVTVSGSRVNSLMLSGQADKPNSFLSGTISPSLVKLGYLDGIYLQNLRNLSGPFPDFLFDLPKLLFVYIENNKLSGELPTEIGKLNRLQALSLEGNKFTGTIPNSISNLTRLSQLKLGQNSLTGGMLLGIRRLQSLTLLSLEENRLFGTIPDIFLSFPELRLLNLSHNRFSGKIPATISYLAPKLAYLDLGHNGLTGHIPDFLGKFTALDTLDLSRNRFTGIVPTSFGNLTKIFNMDLSHNYLIDPFPEMNVKGIESLDLSYNRFHLGQIPNWVTSSPIIYSLKLAGCGIRMKLDEWKPKETYFYDYVDLSDNEISGSPIGLLNRTDDLVGFWASRNKLQFNMGGLRIVKTLKYLDLSRNSVYGKVSGAIAGLEKLNVSYNHLCGQIPSTNFQATAFIGNDCLCGSPLPPCKKWAEPAAD
ncbi:hypothetical protein Nepgr_001954 [Nepenthes gracilis]|uniref:Leucine-rich repeat-containing N-terminal plant-type domain-containing protein n=1 Tax=Nepenthes gracilis TaxID=150966 RepID=A0AAD3P730_NEPGR|nr:hypothetical protein Nepgr_001954 [Nepenthes gracilis]